MDYLQKPIKYDRFLLTLDRLREHEKRAGKKDKQIPIKSAQKEFLINTAHILFVKAVKDYCMIYLEDGGKVMTLGNLKAFAAKWDLTEMFVRVHKSYLVPVSKVKEVLSGGIITVAGYRIPIGRKYKENVKRFFNH